jgi:hypothetical protein
MDRQTLLVEAVHLAWCARSLLLGETPASWAETPDWRRAALEHTVGFWESWEDTEPMERDPLLWCHITQAAWIQYHERRHTEGVVLVGFGELELPQRSKLSAMLQAYLAVRRVLPLAPRA